MLKYAKPNCSVSDTKLNFIGVCSETFQKQHKIQSSRKKSSVFSAVFFFDCECCLFNFNLTTVVFGLVKRHLGNRIAVSHFYVVCKVLGVLMTRMIGPYEHHRWTR